MAVNQFYATLGECLDLNIPTGCGTITKRLNTLDYLENVFFNPNEIQKDKRVYVILQMNRFSKEIRRFLDSLPKNKEPQALHTTNKAAALAKQLRTNHPN